MKTYNFYVKIIYLYQKVLTPEQEKLIDNALGNNSQDEVLAR
jgi:hypothetical protein